MRNVIHFEDLVPRAHRLHSPLYNEGVRAWNKAHDRLAGPAQSVVYFTRHLRERQRALEKAQKARGAGAKEAREEARRNVESAIELVDEALAEYQAGEDAIDAAQTMSNVALFREWAHDTLAPKPADVETGAHTLRHPRGITFRSPDAPLTPPELAGLRFCALPLDERPTSTVDPNPRSGVLERLADRGLITTASRYAALTPAGKTLLARQPVIEVPVDAGEAGAA